MKPSVAKLTIEKYHINKILIVRPDALGDVILTLPLAYELKQNFPNAQIYYLCSSYTKPLLDANPLVTGTIIDSLQKGSNLSAILSMITNLKKHKFDIVFHCYNELPYALLSFFAGIKIRVGDSSKLAPKFLHNRRVNQDFKNVSMHEVDLNLNLLKAIDIKPPIEGKFILPSTPQINGEIYHQISKYSEYIVVHPGIGNGNRSWGVNNFRQLLLMLSKNGYNIVITGGASELQSNTLICQDMDKTLNLTGKTSLLELAYVIERAKVFVSVDTGPMHLAAAYGVRVVVISPTKWVKPTRWGPYGVPNIVVKPEHPCPYRCFPYKCSKTFCLENISISNIFTAIRNVTTIKEKSMEEIKRDWQAISLNILNLSNTDVSQKYSGYNIYNDYTENLFNFIINNDIAIIVVNNKTISLWLITQFAAIFTYYPPKIVLRSQLL